MGKHRNGIEVIARGILVCDGKLLICHTKGASNTYLPGGHVEFGEKAADSLCRELDEELGLSSTAGKMLGVVEHSFVQKGKRHCEINLVFELKTRKLDTSIDPESREEYIEFKWLPLGRLGGSDLEPASLRKLIPGWLKRNHRR